MAMVKRKGYRLRNKNGAVALTFTIGKRFLSHSHLKFLLFAVVPLDLTKQSFGVKLVGFVSFVDIIEFRREIQILLGSWEVKVQETAIITFVHVKNNAAKGRCSISSK